MEDIANISEKILSILASSSNNETPQDDILKATNTPKKTLVAELQKLKRQGVVVKTLESPPIWSLKDSNKVISSRVGSGSRVTRSKTRSQSAMEKHKSLGKTVTSSKVAKYKDSGSALNKDLSKRIVAFLQRRSKAAKTIEIAKGVGCKSAKEINPTLYPMMKKNIVTKVTDTPPSWRIADDIPQEFMLLGEPDIQQNSTSQSNCVVTKVQYLGDGSIPAFQDTTLFSGDLSFDTDFSDLIASGSSPNNGRDLFDMGPANDSIPTNFHDEMNDGEGETETENKPSAFRSFFGLNESMSDESEEEDRGTNDGDENDDDEDDDDDDDDKFSDSGNALKTNVRINVLKDSEESSPFRLDNVTYDANTYAKEQQNSLDKETEVEGKTGEQSDKIVDTELGNLNRNCNATDENIEAEVLPNELLENLPLAQDSDDERGESSNDDENDSDNDTAMDVVIESESEIMIESESEKEDKCDENLVIQIENTCKPKGNIIGMPPSESVEADSFDSKSDETANAVELKFREERNTNYMYTTLNTDCQKLLQVFSSDLPVAQFVLKSKSKLNEEILSECLKELERQHIVVQKGATWQLTDNGKVQLKGMSDKCRSETSVSKDNEMPRRKIQTSGPPPSPMALIQKEKGITTDSSKESPLAFLKESGQKIDPFKQGLTYNQKRMAETSDSRTNSHVDKLNTDLFPAAKTVTAASISSTVLVSASLDIKSSQTIVHSTLPSRPSNTPVPLMSINLSDRNSQRSSMPGLHSVEVTCTASSSISSFVSGPSLFNQGIRPAVNQTLSSASRLLNQPTFSTLRSSVTPQPAAVRGPLGQTQSSITKPAFAQVKGGSEISNKLGSSIGQFTGQAGASSFKPPMTPADILAKSLKKTELSPPKTLDSSPVSLLPNSDNVQLKSTQRPDSSLQSMFRQMPGSQPLLQTNQAENQTIQTSKVSSRSVDQFGFGPSSQTGSMSFTPQTQTLQSQSGLRPFNSQTQTSLQGLGGFKPLDQLVSATPVVKPMSHSSQPLSLDSESFAALNKNPVSALMEYAQSRKLEAKIELIGRRGSAHRPTFEMAAFVGRRQFPSVSCSNKKDGKKEACDVALRQLIAEGQFHQQTEASKPTTAPSLMTHFDKMAALTHRGFTALVSQIRSESFAGRKVIAGLVMKRSQADTGVLISLGTGNRCITGQQLSLEGNTVNDSHAEIITRRGFLRFLYKQLLDYDPNKTSPLFERSSSGKIKIRSNITFHLYISTAPCGDGALFSPRDAASNSIFVDNTVRPPHNPTFTSNVQGLLRTKVEGGEGTIPIEAGFKGQTFDGIQRGERLLTMSCTDKVCRWNVVGLQGALLSHFLEPVYLDSLTLGLLYDHGHLSRAVCCRVGRGDTDIDTLLPEGYRLNHPWLGRVTACEPQREVQKTKALSVNWCFGDTAPEVVDGTLGLNLTSIEKEMFSRCSKRHLFNSFKKLREKFHRQDLQPAQTYREAKDMATDFNSAKQAMLKKFKENKYGKWVSKPVEEEMFT